MKIQFYFSWIFCGSSMGNNSLAGLTLPPPTLFISINPPILYSPVFVELPHLQHTHPKSERSIPSRQKLSAITVLSPPAFCSHSTFFSHTEDTKPRTVSHFQPQQIRITEFPLVLVEHVDIRHYPWLSILAQLGCQECGR